MTDPKYLTDEGSEATTLERELLRAAQGVRLGPSEKQAIWAGVALLALPAAASAAPSVAPAAASKAALGLTPLLKGVLLTVGFGALSAGGYWLSRNEPAPSASAALSVASAPRAASALSAAPVGNGPVVEAPPPAPATPASAAPSKAPIREPSTPDKKSVLLAESTAVLEIRKTLRAGDAGGALRLLERARQRFPNGALSQERQALSIEALAKSGARTAAARKARSFLHAYPESPYASDVQSFVDQ